MTHTAVCVSFS